MKIVSLTGGVPCTPTVLALGMFDGVHMGHRRIIAAAKNKSTELGTSTSVLIFSSSPHGAPELLPLSDRLEELKNAGADIAYIYDFEELRDMSAHDFVKDILCRDLSAKGVVAGYNYRFGRGGEGNSDMLIKLAEENGVYAHICEQVSALGESVSSTRIRRLLGEGDIETANLLLTYPYYLRGPVLHGKELGRKIGLPTINQAFSPSRAPMAHGIYYTKTYIDGAEYISVSNLGAHPTVDKSAMVNLETHILGFDGDLYGKNVTVAFFGRGRGECRFDSVDSLRREILLDCERAKAYFKSKE